MEKILITGGLGNIGLPLTKKLVELGHYITVLDRNDDLDKLGAFRKEVNFIKADIRDFESIRRAAIGVTGIVHLAAMSRVIWGYENPKECVDINVTGFCNVLEAARMAVRKPWVLFGSSREVYGEPDELPAKENTEKKIANIYGVTKLTGEILLEKYVENYGLSGMVQRYSNVYGSWFDQLDRVIPKFILRAKRDLPLIIQGGGQIFDFTHIDDTVDGIIAGIDKLTSVSETYFDDFHILTGDETTLQELAELIIELTESTSEIQYTDARPYDVEKFYGDPSKAEREIGFKSKISIAEGIKRMIDNFGQNDHS